jgi:hypothetical protein
MIKLPTDAGSGFLRLSKNQPLTTLLNNFLIVRLFALRLREGDIIFCQEACIFTRYIGVKLYELMLRERIFSYLAAVPVLFFFHFTSKG